MTQPLSPKDLEEIGSALYGERWQSDIARALGINSRRIRAFMTEERPIPPGVWVELAVILRDRGNAAIDLAKKIEEKCG